MPDNEGPPSVDASTFDASHAVHQAGSCLQKGLDLLRCNSNQPEALKQLSELASAAATHVQSIVEDSTIKFAQQEAIITAAQEMNVASTAAAYFSWFTQGLLSMPDSSDSNSTTNSSSLNPNSSDKNSTGSQQLEPAQQLGCEGLFAAMMVLRAVMPWCLDDDDDSDDEEEGEEGKEGAKAKEEDSAGGQDKDGSSDTTTKTTSSSTDRSTWLELVASVSQATLECGLPGLPAVLSKLGKALTATPESPKDGSIPPALRPLLADAALGLYVCLARAAAASKSPEAAAVVQEEGLLAVVAQLLEGQMSEATELEWAALGLLVETLSDALLEGSSSEPHNHLLLLEKHQRLWWLALSATLSVVQQAGEDKETADPDWISTRLADMLVPAIKLDGIDADFVEHLCPSTILLMWVVGAVLGAADTGGYMITLQNTSRDSAHATPHLLQLQAVAELAALWNAINRDGNSDSCSWPLMLLAVLVEAAEPEVKAAFLGTEHFQLVLCILQQAASMDEVDDLTVQLAPSPHTGTASGAGSSPPSYTLTAPHLVAGLLKVLTMDNSAGGSSGGATGADTRPAGGAAQGLFHPLDPSTPCTSLTRAPGLPLSAPLFGVVEQCVKAEGSCKEVSRPLAECWVQLAAEAIVKRSARPSSTGGASTTTASSEPSNDSTERTTSSNSGEASSSDNNSEPSSWYGALGSLLVSMA